MIKCPACDWTCKKDAEDPKFALDVYGRHWKNTHAPVPPDPITIKEVT